MEDSGKADKRMMHRRVIGCRTIGTTWMIGR